MTTITPKAASLLTCLVVLISFCTTRPAIAADPAPTNHPEPLNLTANQDHQRMMDLLHIPSLRRGADGMNPQSPNYQNTDESKANPYPNLPDPLLLKNGEKVTTPDTWWKERRPEIMEDFDREVYGCVQANTPKVHWAVVKTTRETNGTIPVITKQVVGHVDNSSCPPITVNIDLTLTTPAEAKSPVPIMMEFGFGNFGGRFGRAPTNTARALTNASSSSPSPSPSPPWEERAGERRPLLSNAPSPSPPREERRS